MRVFLHFSVYPATCGGTVYVGSKSFAQIVSPGHPGTYGRNLDCEFDVIGPQGHYLIFEFDSLDLPRAYNCSTADYIQFVEQNATGIFKECVSCASQFLPFLSTYVDPILGTFCGSDRPANVESFSNRVKVFFRTDANGDEGTGFVIRVNASVEGCGGTLEGEAGIIQSPGYPHGYPHRHICDWVIRGPPGRAIRLEFEDFDMEAAEPSRYSNRSYCRHDYLYVSEEFISIHDNNQRVY